MFKLRSSLNVAIALAMSFPLFAQTVSERFYQSVRNDDLVTLRALVRENGPDLKDAHAQTPLMFAAAFGSLDAVNLLVSAGADVKAESDVGVTALHWSAGNIRKVRLLLDRGADVNKASRLGRTPLMIAAGTHGSLEVVELLLKKGAAVNVADSAGFTPLILAAGTDNTAVARLLIEGGADINAKASTGEPATALMGAAHNGNADLTSLLLARGADIKAVSGDRDGTVKNGAVAFGTATALHYAAENGSSEVVKRLLDAGAKVDALDVRGMTPLMFAVATDRPNVDIVRVLLTKGADVSVRSKAGETTVDWARKFNNPRVLSELKLEAVSGGARSPEMKSARKDIPTAQEAVERGLPLLQRASANVFTDGGCVACHAQPVASMAAELTRKRGWRIDEAARKSVSTESDRVVRGLTASIQTIMQVREGGGNPDTQMYEGLMMAGNAAPADQGTDALVHYLLAKQRAAGNWIGGAATRAPIQDGNFSRTAMGIRILSVYGMPGRKQEIAERITRAANWLAQQAPQSTEDRVMQILGLTWARAHEQLRRKRLNELVAQQHSDGGWAQTPYLDSDAYATGQVLYTIHETGSAGAGDTASRRGAEFLLRTQKDDGTWFVRSRAMKIQPYFQSGFPYNDDQWISTAASAWAIMAITVAPPEAPRVAARNAGSQNAR